MGRRRRLLQPDPMGELDLDGSEPGEMGGDRDPGREEDGAGLCGEGEDGDTVLGGRGARRTSIRKDFFSMVP